MELSGYVKNTPEGQVEIYAEGEEQDLLRFLERMRKGPPLAQVEQVAVRWEETPIRRPGFEISYD